MDKKKILKDLGKLFSKKVTEKNTLVDLDFDSLRILELISYKEKYFKKINIKPDQYTKCKNISDLIKLFKIK